MKFYFKRLTLISLILSLVLLVACQTRLSVVSDKSLKGSKNDLVAKMGTVTLTQQYLDEIIKPLSKKQRELLKSTPEALEKLVRDEVIKLYILDLSAKTGWSIRPEVRKKASLAANQAIIASYIENKSKPGADFPSKEQIETAYQANKKQLHHPDQIHLAQIFLAVDQDQDQEFVKQKIKPIHQQLLENPKRFKHLAKQYSQHKSSEQEGDLGWVPQNHLIPGFSAIIERMQPGSISPIINTELGVHILKFIERKKGEPFSLEQASPLIAEQLILQAIQLKKQQYLQNLIIQNPVEITKDRLDKAIE